MQAMRQGFLAGFVMASLLGATACVAPLSDTSERGRDPVIAVGGSSHLAPLFATVGAEYRIPGELLAALSYVETRFELVDASEHNRSIIGLLGMSPEDLARGAALAGVTDHAARTDAEASLRAGAALIRSRVPNARTIDELLEAFDDDTRVELVSILVRGVDGRDSAGDSITIAAQPSLDRSAGYGTTQQALGNADYGPATWSAAYSGNYQAAASSLAAVTSSPGASSRAFFYLACSRAALVLTGQAPRTALDDARAQLASASDNGQFAAVKRLISPRIRQELRMQP